jgi:hypothetical protein
LHQRARIDGRELEIHGLAVADHAFLAGDSQIDGAEHEHGACHDQCANDETAHAASPTGCAELRRSTHAAASSATPAAAMSADFAISPMPST